MSIVVKNTELTLKNAEFGTKKKKSYVLNSPEIFLSLKRGNLLRPWNRLRQHYPVFYEKVSVFDTATQTNPITIVDPAVQSKTTSSNNKTEELLKQKLQSNTTKKSQTKTSIEEKKQRLA